MSFPAPPPGITQDVEETNLTVTGEIIVDTIKNSSGDSIISGGTLVPDAGLAAGNLEFGTTDNTISSTTGNIDLVPASNGDVDLKPSGTGDVNLAPQGTGNVLAPTGITANSVEVGETANTISSALGGLTITGGTGSGGDLNISSTSNATKGFINTDNVNVDGIVQFNDITEPANGADGTGRLFKKTGDDGLFWKPDSGGAAVDLTATTALPLDYSYTNVNASTYTAISSDEILGVTYTTTGACTITLPAITGLKRYIVKDEGGNATTNNITINTTGGDTIDGEANALININYTSLTFYNNGGTGWFVQ